MAVIQIKMHTTYPKQSLERYSGIFFTWAPWILFAQVSTAIALRIADSRNWIGFLYDDFFYYLKVAQNVATGAGSTFNGLVDTNGYHPLWLAVLTVVCKFSTSDKNIFYFVALTCLVSTLVTYFSARRIALNADVDMVLSSALALYTAAFACKQYFSGMEAILVVPLSLLLIARMQDSSCMETPVRAAGTGLLASLTILARLDVAILVALLFLFLLSNQEFRAKLRLAHLAALAFGLLPVAIYILSNIFYFGTLLPVSGMAKQLMPHGIPSRSVLDGMLSSPVKFRINILFWLISLLASCLSFSRLRRYATLPIIPTLAFPAIYFLMLSFLTDWCFSDWYFYPIRMAVCLGAIFWLRKDGPLQGVGRTALQLSVAAVALLALSTNWWAVNPGQVAVYETAEDLARFEITHPGMYAMGDRAGKVGYLMKNPVVQLEGLVMDKRFLGFMKSQTSLIDVLRYYGVKYYIGSSHQAFGNCFQAVESFQAGPRSPRLKGEFCSPPLARYTHSDTETLIYAIDAPAR